MNEKILNCSYEPVTTASNGDGGPAGAGRAASRGGLPSRPIPRLGRALLVRRFCKWVRCYSAPRPLRPARSPPRVPRHLALARQPARPSMSYVPPCIIERVENYRRARSEVQPPAPGPPPLANKLFLASAN
ncbi:hypothetical protein EVAR_75172_1 [Eumeta japonica]|uniref:Uncharacterized protein n=1 Tax=Eumeta variegata TaxID=151549 RepID=A0A4C1U0S0_EUMVA|nr:hypothetical protein EVAR_75172_1 [Eumeta japonica]